MAEIEILNITINKAEVIALAILAIMQTLFCLLAIKRILSFAKIFPKEEKLINDNYEGNLSNIALKYDDTYNKEYVRIAQFINNYISNASIRKLNEVRRITEEHLENVEYSISHFLETPLYLGLFGTILGIIFGLVEYLSLSEKTSIDSIIVAVAVAMSVSGWGLILTVINSQFVFPWAKNKVEEGEETFYNVKLRSYRLPNDSKLFIEADDDFGAAEALANNLNGFREGLEKFNDQLEKNLNAMGSGITRNMESAKKSLQVIERIVNADNLTNLQKVLRIMLNGTEKLISDLDIKFGKIHECIDNTLILFGKMTGLQNAHEDVQTFKQIANNLDIFASEMNERSKNFDTMQTYLQKYIGNLEELEKVSKEVGEEAKNKIKNARIQVDLGFIDMKNSIEELDKSLKEDLQKVKSKIDEAIDSNFVKVSKGFGSLGLLVDDFSKTMEKSVKAQVNEITVGFSKSFEAILQYVEKLKNGVNEVEYKDWVNSRMLEIKTDTEKIIGSQLEGITSAMAIWSKDLEKTTKQDDQPKNNELKESIEKLNLAMESQQELLEEIRRNTQPRNIFKIILGIK